MKKQEFNFRFKDSYFKFRNLNDNKRIKAFILEKKLMNKYISFNGSVCDVGCANGEFLNFLEWKGKKYGMEINKSAITKAKKIKINFDKNILNTSNKFDVIIFRGTLQHIEQPFYYLRRSFEALKKGGYLFILQTPNTDSLHYRLFQDLPALDSNQNFYHPSHKNLLQICKILKFKHCKSIFPYLNSGYEKPVTDIFFFILKFFKIYKKNVNFPDNMMNLVFRK